MAVKVTVYGQADMRQIENARAELDKLESAARTNASGFAGSMSRLSGSLETAGAKMTATGQSMTTSLTIPIAAVGTAIGFATKAAADDAQQQVVLATNLRNTAGASDEAIAATERWITAQGKALGVTDSQLRPALAILAGATGDVAAAQDLAALAMDVSASRGVDLETASKAVAKAYDGNFTSLKKLIPGLDEAAIASGDFNQVQAALADMVGGAATAAADTQAGAMQRSKVAMDEAMESIGTGFLPIMQTLADIMTNSVAPTLQRVGEWFASLSTETKTTIISIAGIVAAAGPALMVFGSMATGASKLVSGISSVAGAAGKAVGGFQNMMTGMTNANAAASSFATPMTKLGGAIASGASAVANFTVSLAKNAAAMAVSAAKWVASTAILIAQKVAVMASAIASGIATAAQWLWNIALTANPIGIIIVAIAALIGALVWFFTQTDLGRAIWQGFVDFIVAVWNGFTEWITGALAALGEWWNGFWSGVGQVISDVWDGFIGWILEYFQLFMLGLQIIGDAISSWWNGLWSAVGSFISDVWNNLVAFVVDYFQNLWLGLKIISKTISDWWNGMWRGISSFVSGIWEGIVKGVSTAIENVIGFFRDLNTKVMDILRGAATWLVNVGKDIVTGLLNGIKNAWTSVVSWITGAVDNVIKSVKNLLGIKSPSRVFMTIGQQIGQGLEAGISSMAGAVSDAAVGLAEAATVSATQTVGLAMSGASSASLLSPAPSYGMTGSMSSVQSSSRSVTVAPGAVQVSFTGDTDSTSARRVVEDAFKQLVRELRAS